MNELKPPLGLMPKNIHDQKRALDITEAIYRYVKAYKKVPIKWLDELSNYILKGDND